MMTYNQKIMFWMFNSRINSYYKIKNYYGCIKKTGIALCKEPY
jgi:hypothetical protein